MGNEYSGQEGDLSLLAGDGDKGRIRFYTDAMKERLTITKDGNVGIGITTPSAKLDVFEDGDGIGAEIARFGNASNWWAFDNTGMPTTRQRLKGYASGIQTIQIDPLGDSFFNGGNIGIGTSPSEKLDVAGNIKVSGNITADGTVYSNSITTSGLGTIAVQELGVSKGVMQWRTSANGTDPSTMRVGTVVASPLNFITSAAVRATIDNSGNLGIGTVSPTEKLDVAGNIKVSGTVDGRDIATDGAKLDNVQDVSTGVTWIDFAKEIDPSNLDEEITLASVPAGYYGRVHVGTAFCQLSITFCQSSGEITSPATVAAYYTPQGQAESTNSSILNGLYVSTTISTNPWLEESTTLRMKVTTAGVGFTQKLLVTGRVYLVPIQN